jgi:hypothetical protein
MNPLIASHWVEKNRKSILRRATRSLNFTPASPIDFEHVAHMIAMQVAKGTADIALFKREFWSCYLAKLRAGGPLSELFIVEENGESTAVITGDEV